MSQRTPFLACTVLSNHNSFSCRVILVVVRPETGALVSTIDVPSTQSLLPRLHLSRGHQQHLQPSIVERIQRGRWTVAMRRKMSRMRLYVGCHLAEMNLRRKLNAASGGTWRIANETRSSIIITPTTLALFVRIQLRVYIFIFNIVAFLSRSIPNGKSEFGN